MRGGCITYSMSALFEGILIVDKADAGFNCKSDYDFKIQRDSTDVFRYDYGTNEILIIPQLVLSNGIKNDGTIYGCSLPFFDDAGDVLFIATKRTDAVNYIEIVSGAIGQAVGMAPLGTDDNINFLITGKGTGGVTIYPITISSLGALSGATSIDGSGDLTMGTITMTGFSVGATGITDALSLKVGGTEVIDSSRNLKNVSNTVDYFSYRRAGRYFTSTIGGQKSTVSSVVVNILWALPFIVSKTSSFDRIAIKVTTAGDADTVGRLGIYSDDGNVYPGTLVLDAGTVAVDAAAVVEIIINQQLTPGLYWLVLVHNSTTSPAMQASTSVVGLALTGTPYGIFGVDNTLVHATGLGDAWYVAFNYANLPATFPESATINTADYPLIFLRAV